MRNLKKFLALVLAMMMTLSLMVTVNASSFKDVEDNNAYAEAIDTLAAFGILEGQGADATGEFQPKGTITRAEMAAVLYRVVTGDVGKNNIHLYEGYKSFTDLNDGAWYIPYVNYCENNGLINGVGGGKFEPQEKLTGYQALVMMLRAMGYNNPNEFSSSDWKLKASGYGRKLGITDRISEGSLGAPATRESVAEIVFQAIQKPTVSYNMLLGYTNEVLVAAYQKDDEWVYDHDVYNTLLYQVFGVVGKRTIYGSDGKYGRPTVDWVKDAKDDTVENGGKYIVNPQASQDLTTAAQKANVKGNIWVTKNAVYVPINTPGATYGKINDPVANDGFVPDDDSTDVTYKSISLAPVYTFNTAMTECAVSKAINNDKTISWNDITEYVNGGLVVNRNDKNDNGQLDYAATGDNDGSKEAKFDALHTTNTGTAGKTDYTIGAAGRQTEIYNLGDVDNDDNDEWIFVYIDTMLGEVVKVVPHTLDTNDHIVTNAQLHIAVNDSIKGDSAIVMTQKDNYTQKVGDMVLLTTWGLKDGNYDNAGAAGNAWNKQFTKIGKGAASAIAVNDAILNAVPADEKVAYQKAADGSAADGNVDGNRAGTAWVDYQLIALHDNPGNAATPDDATDDKYVKGSAWAVEFASKSVGENTTVPTTTVKVDATVGLSEDKTGIISGGKTIPTTWAYHVDQGQDSPATDDMHHTAVNVDDDSMLAKFHTIVKNSIIGQTYTAALDKNGNIVGMWPGSASKMIGVVTDVDYVRVGLGKYAVEMEIFTTEEKTETVRLLDLENGNTYFPTQEEADKAITTTPIKSLGIGGYTEIAKTNDAQINPKGALVELTSYAKDGETYWAVTDMCEAATKLEFVAGTGVWLHGDADTDGIVVPGKADTLLGTADDDSVDAAGETVNTGSHSTAFEVTDETVFIVAEYDFQYNTKPGSNDGSNINVRYKVYNGFRNLPVISGDQNVDKNTTTAGDTAGNEQFNIAFQVLDSNLASGKTEAKHVLISAFNPNMKYTQSKHSTFNPDNSFLVIAPVATYAAYSEYLVAKNGTTDTIKVANINGTVNADLQAAIRTKGLLVATSENSLGYITAVEEVKLVQGGPTNNPNLGNDKYVDTLIPQGSGLAYSKGVLSYSVNAWDANSGAKTGDAICFYGDTHGTGWVAADSTDNSKEAYVLTVAEGCIVKIVNVDEGKLFDATLDHIKQYQATSDIVFELDSNGWVSCLYIID